MKLAIQILSYTLAILMGLGCLIMIGDGTMDVGTFLAVVIVEVQTIMTLVYIHEK